MRIRVQHVRYIPKDLAPGVLYVSKAFGTAAHLCPCGCGSKIRTPLGPTEWAVEETSKGPTLRPSVGNWQKPCQSHYWIWRGEIRWCDKWSSEQIASGKHAEEKRRRAYHDALGRQRFHVPRKFWQWIKGILGR